MSEKKETSVTHFDFEDCYCKDRQKLSSLSTTVLYRTILTQVIIFHVLMKWLLGSGDSWHGPEIWRQSSQKALTVDRKQRKNFDGDNPFLSSEGHLFTFAFCWQRNNKLASIISKQFCLFSLEFFLIMVLFKNVPKGVKLITSTSS